MTSELPQPNETTKPKYRRPTTLSSLAPPNPHFHPPRTQTPRQKGDVGDPTCRDQVDDTGFPLHADQVGGPAQQRPVVLLERSRVVEHGRGALVADGLQGHGLAPLRRPVEAPREVHLEEEEVTG